MEEAGRFSCFMVDYKGIAEEVDSVDGHYKVDLSLSNFIIDENVKKLLSFIIYKDDKCVNKKIDKEELQDIYMVMDYSLS